MCSPLSGIQGFDPWCAPDRSVSTALISRRMNLSPFTKGSRVLRAFNVILSIFVRITPLTYLQNHHIESVCDVTVSNLVSETVTAG